MTTTPRNIAALGFARQPDRDNRGDEEDCWEYVTDDGFRVVRVTGSRRPWLIFPPKPIGWRSVSCRSLIRAATVIEEIRNDPRSVQ